MCTPKTFEERTAERAGVVLEGFKTRFCGAAERSYSPGEAINVKYATPEFAQEAIFAWLFENGWGGVYRPFFESWTIDTRKEYNLKYPPAQPSKQSLWKQFVAWLRA